MQNYFKVVINDLETRKDFQKISFPIDHSDTALSGTVLSGPEARDQLSNCQTAYIKFEKGGPALSGDLLNTTLQTINAVIDSNQGMQQMGQLNIKRTLPPNTAKAHNEQLKKLRATVELLQKDAAETSETDSTPISESTPTPTEADLEAVAAIDQWLEAYYPPDDTANSDAHTNT